MSVDGAGFTEQPLSPARASDAPISARNCRRLSASGQTSACSGNSRASLLEAPRCRPVPPGSASSACRCAAASVCPSCGQFGVEVFPAVHRWHVEQLVRLTGSLTLYCFDELAAQARVDRRAARTSC